MNQLKEEMNLAAKVAKAEPIALVKKIEAMHEEIKALISENEKLKSKIANASVGNA